MSVPIEPEMNGPDWGRYGLRSPLQHHPVGDPTRWGANVQTLWRPYIDRNVYTGQIVQVATTDGYARPWSIIGELTMNSIFWNFASQIPASTIGMNVILEVTMGGGQTQIVHEILLMSGRNVGLCNDQTVLQYDGSNNLNVYRGGPYMSSFVTLPAAPFANYESRPFAAIGSVVSNAISIRARYSSGDGTGYAGPTTIASRLSVLVTPYAAGEGL